MSWWKDALAFSNPYTAQLWLVNRLFRAKHATPLERHITSNVGKPVALLYGTRRLGGNLIWFDPRFWVPGSRGRPPGQGAGSLVFGIAEGPIIGFGRWWKDKKEYASIGTSWASALGAAAQAPWSFVSSLSPSEALGYSGTAWVAHLEIETSNLDALASYNFEVHGIAASQAIAYPQAAWAPSTPYALGDYVSHTGPDGTSAYVCVTAGTSAASGGPSSAELDIPDGTAHWKYIGPAFTAYDADPTDVITDLLTHATHGAAWPSSYLDDLTTGADSYHAQVNANGFFISFLVDSQRAAADCVRELLDATNAEALWSPSRGKLRIVPLGDSEVIGNGVTYTPSAAVAYNLGPNDILGPLQIQQVRLADTYNCVPVEFSDPLRAYDANQVEDVEQSDVDQYGLRRASPLSLRCITRSEHAKQVAKLKAQRSCWVRNVAKFRLPWKYSLLEPLDLVTLTDPMAGLSLRPFRIKEIEKDATGILTVTAWEWPYNAGTVKSKGAPRLLGGYVHNSDVDPGSVSSPQIVAGPATADGGAEVWIAAAGLGTYWGGCNVLMSIDGGTTYFQIGTIEAADLPAYGALAGSTAMVASTPGGLDATAGYQVDLGVSTGTLSSTTAEGRDGGTNLALIGNELVSFMTASLASGSVYSFSSVRRGMLGTTNAAHAIGTAFMLMRGVFRYPLGAQLVGKALKFKFQSFNTYGGGVQDLATVTAYDFTPSQRAMTAPIPAVAGGPTPAEPGSVTGPVIAAGALDLTKFPSSLRPVQIVTSLPTLPSASYPQGATVVLTTDNKLYRSTGSAWIASVPTADLSGQIGTTQIADDAITTQKIAALAVTAAELAANAVTAGKLAADAVTAGTIAAGAVTADALAANAIQTTNYAEDASGNPTAGAKLDTTGVAAKFAPGNFQVGKTLFNDLWFGQVKFAALTGWGYDQGMAGWALTGAYPSSGFLSSYYWDTVNKQLHFRSTYWYDAGVTGGAVITTPFTWSNGDYASRYVVTLQNYMRDTTNHWFEFVVELRAPAVLSSDGMGGTIFAPSGAKLDWLNVWNDASTAKLTLEYNFLFIGWGAAGWTIFG